MGLFDFLKPKKHPLEAARDNPKWRPAIVQAEAERLLARCNNLKAVGREVEAAKDVRKFLGDLALECVKKEFLESNAMLSLLVSTSSNLGEPELGKDLLEAIIAYHLSAKTKKGKTVSAMDLTQAYIDAGSLAHQIGDPDEEYRCFWLATEFQPPAGCENPASKRQKAIAHQFAYVLCAAEASNDPIKWGERRAYHDAKRRELAPECDWGDLNAEMKWQFPGMF